ncbi:MAG: 4Fe-4S binding protein [Methanobrevibacter sp.]|jgi:energy-converting hydrogenase A subunit Q|nr:4Fe-4S binding protein [Candidatus Methanovirga australis]
MEVSTKKCQRPLRDVVVDYEIDPKKCLQCVDKPCIKSCPVEAIYLVGEIANINERCIGCILCREACPYDAIRMDTQLSPPIKENVPIINQKLCRACGACVNTCKTGSIHLTSSGNDEVHSEINSDTCVRCGYCFRTCPTDAIKYGELIPQTVSGGTGLLINQDICIGCMTCTRVCPSKGSIKIGEVSKLPYIDPSYCARCEECIRICPTLAIDYDTRENVFAEFSKIESLELVSKIIYNDVETLSTYIARIDSILPKLFKTISNEYDADELELNVTEVVKNELDLLIGTKLSVSEIKDILEFFPPLRKISVIEENCVGCGECIDICPVNSIWLKQPSPISIEDTCIFCGKCVEKCNFNAISLKDEFLITKNQDVFFIRKRIANVREGFIEINQDSCQSCGVCTKICPVNALSFEDADVLIDRELCINCRECEVICPVNAIRLN